MYNSTCYNCSVSCRPNIVVLVPKESVFGLRTKIMSALGGSRPAARSPCCFWGLLKLPEAPPLKLFLFGSEESWYPDLGSKILAPRSWYKILLPESRYGIWVPEFVLCSKCSLSCRVNRFRVDMFRAVPCH